MNQQTPALETTETAENTETAEITSESQTKPSDNCPRWAVEMILRIRDLEVQLGNLRPDSSEPWKVANITDVYSRLEDPESSAVFADLVESLFGKLAVGLKDAGFDSEQIAALINTRIPSGRLPYCNSAEVQEALKNS